MEALQTFQADEVIKRELGETSTITSTA